MFPLPVPRPETRVFRGGASRSCFEHRRGPETAATAHGYERSTTAAPSQLVDCRGTEACAGRAHRMAERNRAPVDVDALRRRADLALPCADDTRERFVDFEDGVGRQRRPGRVEDL